MAPPVALLRFPALVRGVGLGGPVTGLDVPHWGWLMFGVDSDIGSSALRLWGAAGSTALLVCLLMFDWMRTRTLARAGIVLASAVLGAVLAWSFVGDTANLGAERRMLEMRAAALNAAALAPGSPLACLDAVAGDTVEAACEKAIFATPASVAAASSYVAARLALLADIAGYTRRGGGTIDGALLPLRRALEADRFGLVAHTLAVRDGCSGESCKPLSLLHDPNRVRANLNAQTLDRLLDHYTVSWARLSDTPVADATAAEPGASGQATAQAPHKVVDIDFPSAASIPAISIMNPEPNRPVPGGANTAGAAAGNPNAQAASAAQKRSTKKAGNAPAQAAAAAPPAEAPSVDPVWTPGATTAVPPSSPAAGSSAPIQLNPMPTAPETGGSAHAP